MTPYIILFAALLLSGFLETNKVLRLKIAGISSKFFPKSVYAILPVVIILILGIFRETTVGYDSEAYYLYYWSQVDRYSWMELLTDFSIDNGFFLILKVIALFTDNWWAVRAILFVLTFGLYYVVIREESPYPSMSVLVFIGLSNLGLMFSILRQALAGAVCMFAYRQIRKGSWGKCLILIIVAATIHKTAFLCIFMLILYFLRMRKFSGFKLILFSILSYTVFFVSIPLITVLYANSQYVDIAKHDGGYGMLLFIIVVLALLAYLMRITEAYTDNDLSYMFNLSCGALFIQIGALQWSLLNRATVFFSIYWCMLFPKLIYCLPRRKRLQCYLIVAVLFGFMFFHQLAEAEMFLIHQF